MRPRAALYARISEKDEKFDKVELQLKRLTKLAKDNGYLVVDEWTDEKSGWSGVTRKGWLDLLAGVAAKKYDVVLAVAEDRFSRNSQEKIGFQVECAKAGVTWHTISGGIVNPKDASGGLLGTITGAIAEYESNIKSLRLKARFEDETSKGNPLWGTRPFGYKLNRLELEPTEAVELKKAYRTILSGGSIYGIIKDWNERGVRTSTGRSWSYATVQQMLRRPRNAGIVMRHDVPQNDVQAAWETIVSPQDWQAVMDILSDSKRRTAPGRKQSHLSAGLIKCGVCGGVMRSASVKLKGVVTPIYKCSAKMNVQALGERHTSIQTNLLDPMIREAVVSAFVFGPEEAVPGLDAPDTDPLEASLSAVRGARARIVKLVASDLIDEGDAAKELGELKAKEAGIVEQLAELARSNAQASMAVDLRKGLWSTKRVSFDQVAKAKVALRERFDGLDLDKKRELVRQHLDVTIYPGRSADRVKIHYKRAAALNDEAEIA